MPQDPNALLVIAVIIAGISVLKQVSDIVATWRRKPSIDKELQDFMPRKEVQAHINDLREEDDKIWTRVNGMDKTISKERGDIQRALGRLEGKIDKLANGAG